METSELLEAIKYVSDNGLEKEANKLFCKVGSMRVACYMIYKKIPISEENIEMYRKAVEKIMEEDRQAYYDGISFTDNMMEENELYNAITTFADKYGSPKYNDCENMREYDNLVDLCIRYGKIPECNRKEHSTHSELEAAIVYIDNREAFCK